MKISVVIPCYYSEKMIAKVVTLTREQLVNANLDYEFLLVNDGSTDGTFAEIEKLCAEDSNIVGINCAKNLGQHSAIMAGLRQTQGDLVMLMDDDMQTHPSQCMKLINAIIDSDVDVVFAAWPEHKEAWWRRAGGAFSRWSMRVLDKRPKDIYDSNFLVMRSHIRDEIIRYNGPYVYIQGLLFRATGNMKNIEVQHFEREEGSSGYTLKTLIKLWSTILNFSMMPLRCASVVGSILGLIGFIGCIAVVVQKLINPSMQAGWPSLMAIILFCSGAILVFLGLIGEYLGRLFMTINKAPQYVLKRVIDKRAPKDGTGVGAGAGAVADGAGASADMSGAGARERVDAGVGVGEGAGANAGQGAGVAGAGVSGANANVTANDGTSELV